MITVALCFHKGPMHSAMKVTERVSITESSPEPTIKFIRHITELDAYIEDYDYVLIHEKDIKKREIKELDDKQRRDCKNHDNRIHDKFHIIRDGAKDHMSELIAELNLWKRWAEYDRSWRQEPLRSHILGLNEGCAEMNIILEQRIELLEQLVPKTTRYVCGSLIGEYRDIMKLRYGIPMCLVMAKYW